jgi:hypothetical protein
MEIDLIQSICRSVILVKLMAAQLFCNLYGLSNHFTTDFQIFHLDTKIIKPCPIEVFKRDCLVLCTLCIM